MTFEDFRGVRLASSPTWRREGGRLLFSRLINDGEARDEDREEEEKEEGEEEEEEEEEEKDVPSLVIMSSWLTCLMWMPYFFKIFIFPVLVPRASPSDVSFGLSWLLIDSAGKSCKTHSYISRRVQVFPCFSQSLIEANIKWRRRRRRRPQLGRPRPVHLLSQLVLLL